MDKIVIWGVGAFGKLAYHYYENQAKIVCFVDSNKDLWGTCYEGIKICNPEVLSSLGNDIKIIIAVKAGFCDIQELLYKRFSIDTVIRFNVYSKVERYITENNQNIKSQIIIVYKGGLGNQLFQYAFSRCFLNKNVTACLEDYNNVNKRSFVLKDCFPKMRIVECDHFTKQYYEKKNYYCEHDDNNCGIGYFKMNEGLFEGFWQNYHYVEKCWNKIKNEFVFKESLEPKLQELVKTICEQNAVAIHFRRTDYLDEKYMNSLGGICTDTYYENAIEYIKSKIINPVFFVFSDDSAYAETMTHKINGISICRNKFEDYQDWYDMLLMGKCKHNIIANSSFSWWGAWLNDNPEKIVIAPKKWHKYVDYPDICPPDWVRL